LEELNALRLEPLGMDRRFNRYWLLCCPDFSLTSAYTGAADDFANNTSDIPGTRVSIMSAPRVAGSWVVGLQMSKMHQPGSAWLCQYVRRACPPSTLPASCTCLAIFYVPSWRVSYCTSCLSHCLPLPPPPKMPQACPQMQTQRASGSSLLTRAAGACCCAPSSWTS
jgi:hypothetical protein